ncbi:MAG TPA: mandelate racemase/muconate lactonizing enzyme family protein [Chloroflexota bacterium]|nr:mandelate racemase/muconate lactonizing enzyme family protein [Chloroflexota bacterium]
MRVTAIKTWLVQPERGKTCLFLKAETDAGIAGWGEAYTLSGRERALERLVLDLGGYLVGRDPFAIKHFTHVLWRDVSIKRGGFDFYCALSGLELALWDIVGKALGTPVYNLLGGPCRTSIGVYGQPSGEGDGSPEGLGRRAANTVALGYNALKFDPFPGPWQMLIDHSAEALAVARVQAVREAVGPGVEILIEVHRRLAPMHAVSVARAIAPFRPFWFEEPTPAEDLAATAQVRRKIDLPVVAGEALYTKAEFRRAFEAEAADIINPDVCNVGGLLELKEIGAMAEAYTVAVAPHGNNSTTVGLAASLHAAAVMPNFLIMEYPLAWEATGNVIARNPLRVERGAIALPDAPGLGIELDEAALERYPMRAGSPRRLLTPDQERP